MKTFLNERRRSAGYARDRMKLLLISERIRMLSTDDENVKKRSGT